MATLFV